MLNVTTSTATTLVFMGESVDAGPIPIEGRRRLVILLQLFFRSCHFIIDAVCSWCTVAYINVATTAATTVIIINIAATIVRATIRLVGVVRRWLLEGVVQRGRHVGYGMWDRVVVVDYDRLRQRWVQVGNAVGIGGIKRLTTSRLQLPTAGCPPRPSVSKALWLRTFEVLLRLVTDEVALALGNIFRQLDLSQIIARRRNFV